MPGVRPHADMLKMRDVEQNQNTKNGTQKSLKKFEFQSIIIGTAKPHGQKWTDSSCFKTAAKYFMFSQEWLQEPILYFFFVFF